MVGLQNRASKPVSGVKLAWSLSTEESSEAILQRGETSIIDLDSTFQSRGTHILDFTTVPVVAFDKIHKPFVKNGILTGQFRIDVVVSEVVYTDGSTWKRSDLTNVPLRATPRKVSRPVSN